MINYLVDYPLASIIFVAKFWVHLSKHPMKLRILLFALVCCTGYSSLAQSEEFWFGLKISSVTKKTGNQVLVTIDRGSEIGLKKGDQGEVWTILQRERKEEGHYLNTIVLQEVALKRASGLIEVEEPLYEGDILFVKIPIKFGFNSSFFYFISYKILFLNIVLLNPILIYLPFIQISIICKETSYD